MLRFAVTVFVVSNFLATHVQVAYVGATRLQQQEPQQLIQRKARNEPFFAPLTACAYTPGSTTPKMVPSRLRLSQDLYDMQSLDHQPLDQTPGTFHNQQVR
jgi:hypothetical protein